MKTPSSNRRGKSEIQIGNAVISERKIPKQASLSDSLFIEG